MQHKIPKNKYAKIYPINNDSPYIFSYIYMDVKITTNDNYIQTKLEDIYKSKLLREWIEHNNKNNIKIIEFIVTDFNISDYDNFIKGYSYTINNDNLISMPVTLKNDVYSLFIVFNIIDTINVYDKYIVLYNNQNNIIGQSIIEVYHDIFDEITRNMSIENIFTEYKFSLKKNIDFIDNLKIKLGLEKININNTNCEILHLDTHFSNPNISNEKNYMYSLTINLLKKDYDLFLQHKKSNIIIYNYRNFDKIIDLIGSVKTELCWNRYKKLMYNKINY